jgi:hypothetical protein
MEIDDLELKKYDIAEELAGKFIIVSKANPMLWGYMTFEIYYHNPEIGILFIFYI